MAAEPTLILAANNAWQNMFQWWVNGTLETRLDAFAASLLPTFPESNQVSHPISNWLVIIQALSRQMSPAGLTNPFSMRMAIDYIYRTCLLTNRMIGQIGAPAGAAVLASYNANF